MSVHATTRENMKPIDIWMSPPGPNPWKIILLLEELSLPYDVKLIRFEDVKKKPFIDINPNGRVPAIVDPNTEIKLWETGAIAEYLVERYDGEGLLTHGWGGWRLVVEREELGETVVDVSSQWTGALFRTGRVVSAFYISFYIYIFFGVRTGGTIADMFRFTTLHSEKIPSAIDRYVTEVRRVLSVLDQALEGKSYLVGNRITYADLMFVPYNDRIDAITGFYVKNLSDWPNVERWQKGLTERATWKRAMEKMAIFTDQQGLQWNGMPKGVENMKQYEEKMRREGDL